VFKRTGDLETMEKMKGKSEVITKKMKKSWIRTSTRKEKAWTLKKMGEGKVPRQSTQALLGKYRKGEKHTRWKKVPPKKKKGIWRGIRKTTKRVRS